MKRFYFILLLLLPFKAKAIDCDLSHPVKIYKPRYATHFTIYYYEKFKVINTDDGPEYFLTSEKNLKCSTSLTKIHTPVKKVIMMSTTYLPALSLLDKEKTLIGFQGKHYIVSQRFSLDLIKEVPFKFNPEDLLTFKADLVMGFDSNLISGKQKKIFKALDLPVAINKDFDEKTPLGRAEWLIFISSFYNLEEKAQAIFSKIELSYLNLKKKNLLRSTRRKVLVGEIQNGRWATCGGESDLSQMISDAGGDLVFFRKSSSSQSLSLEEVGLNKERVDVWLTHNSWASKNEMEKALKKDGRYLLINPKNIYNNNRIVNSHLANDYWETGLQRPDLLLLDLTAIFYPDDNKNHSLYWYRKL